MNLRWDPTPTTRARLALVAEVAAVVFTLALRWWITRDRFVYSVTTDEASQLAMARTLSGARPFHVLGNAVDAGFGTLVAPIYVFVEDPELAFRLVLGTNVVLAGLTLVVLRAVVVRVVRSEGPAATWAAAIALALPGAALQTPWTGSEVFVVFVVALVLLLAVMMDGPHASVAAIGLAAVGATSVLVHSRLALVVPAVLVLLVAAAFLGETSRRVAVVAVVVLSVLTWAALQYNDWVHELVWLSPSPESDQLSELLERLGRPLAILASAAGMAWTQMVTTFGLAVLGLGHLLATIVRRDGAVRIGPTERMRWKILLVLAAAALPAVVFMADRDRAWFMVYGRYWDALAVPVVAIGVAHLLRVGRRRGSRAFAGALLVTGLASVAFALVRADRLLQLFEDFGSGNPRRIAGLFGFIGPGAPIDVPLVTALALTGMGAVLAVLVVTRRRYRLAAVVALVGIATVATVRGSIHLNEYGLGLTRWRPAMELVESGILPADATVAFQVDEAYWDIDPRFPFTAYQFYEPDVEFVGLEGEAVLEEDWVVASRDDPLLRERGWEIVYLHPDGRGTAVWARP